MKEKNLKQKISKEVEVSTDRVDVRKYLETSWDDEITEKINIPLIQEL